MIVWVDDLIFAGTFRDVDRLALLRNAAQRRHTLIISDNVVPSFDARRSPNFDTWLGNLPVGLRREVDLLQDASRMISPNAMAHGGTIRVLVSERVGLTKGKASQLSLTDAIRALSLPLSVMVENQINDGAFLRRVLPPLWRARLLQWERTGEMRFSQGGGNTEIARLIEFHSVEENARLASGLPSEIWNITHFFVYDHDGDSPQQPGKGARKLDDLCGVNYGHHRLWRRTQEHYLPGAVLYEIINHRLLNGVDRNTMSAAVKAHLELGEARHFSPLPQLGNEPFFKNEFSEITKWSDELAEQDGMWPEMSRLAESIAAAI